VLGFCTLNYAVDFPMTSKIDVIGPNAHPLYKWVRDTLGGAAEPSWNFHKLLIGKDGQIAEIFGSRTPPEDPEVRAAIEAAL
jgi:glutathione peroxidase